MTKAYKYVSPVFMDVRAIANLPYSYEMTLPSHNFNAFTNSRKVNEIFADDITNTVWQPDVYYYAREIADLKGITQIVDIGCGSGEKLLAAFSDNTFTTVGVDYAESLKIVTQKFPDKQWVETNLTDAEAIEYTFSHFHDETPRLYILSDVIEHLIDPRLLLRKLRQLLKLNPNNVFIVSTPDSKRGMSYDQVNNLPNNKHHVREWTLDGLTSLFKASGFTIEASAHTRSNLLDNLFCTCLVVLSATESMHRNILRSLELPSPKRSLILTTEYSDTKMTGGIGSYVKEIELATKSDRPIVMFCNNIPYKDVMTTDKQAENIVDLFDLVENPKTEFSSEWHAFSTSIFLATQNLLFFYDQIRHIEYQEYLGVGARLSQAKCMGNIPFNISLVVRCHGSQLYLDRASSGWSGLESGDIFELERMSIRYADKVSFASKYLQGLYMSTGYEFKTTELLRYPYSFPKVSKPKYSDITRLTFLGKRGPMKGYDEFCYMVDVITDPKNKHFNPQIKEVSVIGAPISGYEHLDSKLEKIMQERDISLTFDSPTRAKLLKTIEQSAPDTLICLPYAGDNHPVIISEVLAYRCPFIAYAQGGIPEIIPPDFHSLVLCQPNRNDFVQKVAATLKVKPAKLGKELSQLYQNSVNEQKLINAKVCESYIVEKEFSPRKPNIDSRLVTVMVPVYGTELEYVYQLIISLNRQSLPPKEVIFVNDASPEVGYLKSLKELIEQHLRIPFKIISHEKNLGLSGARNTALFACNTKYLINVDSDDVIANDFVYDYVNFLEGNPEFSVAICGLESFNDQENWENAVYDSRLRYVGIGDCYILGVTKNIFGHSGSCVVVADARAAGGWDASDKSMWEDWAFYLKLTTLGKKIFNFPKLNYFYRVNDESMVRTYPRFPAELRLARNIRGMGAWDAQRLYACLNTPVYKIAESVAPSPIDSSFAGESLSHARSFLHKHPYIRKTGKATLSLAWTTGKLLKRRK